ncbi:MAG TPA: DUF5668 domain-containing protein [Cyclobacteriaceae bacterium]|nr:DUF5668 domain-containing protein [Cyclobacteriaceae bacterium]
MKPRRNNSNNNNLTAGLLILIVGSVLLLQRMGVFFPGWIFSWPMMIIAIALVILVKHQFRSGAGFFMLLFGTFFLLKREFDLPVDIGEYLIPVGLILLGLYLMIFRQNYKAGKWAHWNDGWGDTSKQKRDPFYTGNPEDTVKGAGTLGQEQTKRGTASHHSDSGDFLHSQALFCGVQKRVLSKNFFGGKISNYFGGTEIDLSQADLSENAILDLDVAFGGVKLVIPPHWDLKIDVANVFAGIEDKRMYAHTPSDPTKVLVIRGTVIFGGLEIKSF